MKVTVFMLASLLTQLSLGSHVEIAGDVTIVGLFGVHQPNSGKCGSQIQINSVMHVEAVKWYIESLNRQGDLPLNIGLMAYETCRTDTKAAEIAIDVMDMVLVNSTIIGILGPEYSSEAERISPILSSVPSDNMLVQVGFTTTATRLFEESGKYPNYVSVVQNDRIQIETMVQAMTQLEWNRVAILYEDDIYGDEGAHLLKTRAEEENICVSYIKSISVRDGVNVNEINGVLNDITTGEEHRPPISGLVLIGSVTTANAIFDVMQGLSIAPLPIVMLSEGVNLNTNVFKQKDGGLLTKAKGTLAFSPPYKEIVDFTQHWKEIFTNATKFQIESKSNPWLVDVREAISCIGSTGSCPFKELTNSELTSNFAEQPLYVQYAIKAAHLMVKSVVDLQERYCSTEPGLCSDFKSNFQTGQMVEQMKGISVNFDSDFSWRLQDPPPPFSINTTGQINTLKNSATYELYNFKKASPKTEDFELVRVGELINGNLSLRRNDIRDYDTQGSELQWPNIRIAQCSVGSDCVDCSPDALLHERLLIIPGDVYVVGLVPVYNSDGKFRCTDIRTISGYQVAEAIRFAIQKVNTKSGDYDGYFSNLKVGLIVINSCDNQVIVQRKIYDLFNNGITLPDNTSIEVKDKIIGVVGSLGSSISIAAAETLSRLQYVQISYASTNPQLSDRKRFPYFMRVVTPVDSQARTMIETLMKLGINYIQIVYSIGAYGEGGRDEVKKNARLNNVCIAQEIPVDERNSEHGIYDKLLVFSHAKLVIVFLRSHMVDVVMPVLSRQIEERGHRGEFIFMGSEAWATKQVVLDHEKNLGLLGSFTLSIELYQDKQLRSFIQNMRPESYKVNPWSIEYLQAKWNCYFTFSYDKKNFPAPCDETNDGSSNLDFTLDSWDTPAYVSTQTLLIGANQHLTTQCGKQAGQLCEEFRNNPAGLVNEILKIKLDLDGQGNKIKVFDENGNGNVGYRIYNIQRDQDSPQKLLYVPVGRYPLDGTFTFETAKVVQPTEEPFSSVCPNEKVCAACQEIKETPKSEPTSSGKGNDTALIIVGVLFGIAVLVIFIMSYVIYRRNNYQEDDKNIYLTPAVPTLSNPEHFDSIWCSDDISPCGAIDQTSE